MSVKEKKVKNNLMNLFLFVNAVLMVMFMLWGTTLNASEFLDEVPTECEPFYFKGIDALAKEDKLLEIANNEIGTVAKDMYSRAEEQEALFTESREELFDCIESNVSKS